ncbi:MAG: dihydropteroate synthase [Bacteroidota bacterium]
MNNFSTSSTLFSRNFSLHLGERIVDLSKPLVMGIINATPDSFFQGSRLPQPSEAMEVAGRMLDAGAVILDVGAVSTRPGAGEIPEEEELSRLSPVVEAIRTRYPECAISVDTWRSGVALTMHRRFSINMVNDISAGLLDPLMFSTMADLKIPYVMMHMQGKPEDMQKEPEYKNVTDDLLQFFGERIFRLRKLGIHDIVIDPGFGFGKTLEQNYQLLRELGAFSMLELPVMVGVSRKSMIYKTLDTDPGNAMNGTTAAHMAALLGGASILRVHDVKEAVETVKIFQQIMNRPSHSV